MWGTGLDPKTRRQDIFQLHIFKPWSFYIFSQPGSVFFNNIFKPGTFCIFPARIFFLHRNHFFWITATSSVRPLSSLSIYRHLVRFLPHVHDLIHAKSFNSNKFYNSLFLPLKSNATIFWEQLNIPLISYFIFAM